MLKNWVLRVSQGVGTASNMVVEKKFSDVVLGEENYYLASLPMAADCYNVGFENPTPTPAKILFLHGGADDYTLAKYCVKYAEKMKKAGGDVEIIVKEGWHHNFYTDSASSINAVDVCNLINVKYIFLKAGFWMTKDLYQKVYKNLFQNSLRRI